VPVLRGAHVAGEAARGGGGWGHVAAGSSGAGGSGRRDAGQTWDGCLQVATAAYVGKGDAAELGGELVPGTGEDAVWIVRPGGCGHAGQRGDGLARNNIGCCYIVGCVVSPELRVI
jgi:hypothetical protein